MCAVSGLVLAISVCVSQGEVAPTSAPPPAPPPRAPLILVLDSLPDPSQGPCLERAHVGPWVPIGQDPKSYEIGVVDLDVIFSRIEERKGGRLPEWMMLDFEDPFFKNLAAPRDSPEYKRTVADMVNAIRAVKQRWPQSKWTFYGLPNVPFWLDGKGWLSAPRDAMKKALGDAAAAAAPIIDECDWVSVSIYDFYDPLLVIPGSPNSVSGTPESVRAEGREWRKARVGLARLMARGKPVIPNVCPFYAPGGVAPAGREIPERQFIEDQIVPAVSEGVAGFAIWTGMDYRIKVATTNNPSADAAPEKGFGVLEWRRAFSADYLNGRMLVNWADPEIREKLQRDTSRFLCRTVENIRLWEGNGALPPPPNAEPSTTPP